jgi:hypothetical protein
MNIHKKPHGNIKITDDSIVLMQHKFLLLKDETNDIKIKRQNILDSFWVTEGHYKKRLKDLS